MPQPDPKRQWRMESEECGQSQEMVCSSNRDGRGRKTLPETIPGSCRDEERLCWRARLGAHISPPSLAASPPSPAASAHLVGEALGHLELDAVSHHLAVRQHRVAQHLGFGCQLMADGQLQGEGASQLCAMGKEGR